MSDITIIYIHGFASIGNSYKGNLLLNEFSNYKVLSPTFSPYTKTAVKQIDELIKTNKNVILVGTSLGGFYSDYFHTTKNIPAVIINPLVEPLGVEKYVGENTNYYTNEKFDFTRESFNYLLELKSIKESSSGYRKYDDLLTVLLAEDDDLLEYKLAINEYNDNSIKLYPTGGHRFTNSQAIIDAVNSLLSKNPF